MTAALIMYIVEIQCTYVDAIVYINDIPALRVTDCQNSTKQGRVNYFILEGKNTISVSVKLPEDAANSSKLKLRLIRGTQGQEPEQADFLIDTEKIPANTRFFTPVYKGEFVSPDNQPKWAWQQAEAITLDDNSKKELVNYVSKIHVTLKNQQANKFVEYFAHKSDELGKSLGFAGAEITSGMYQQYDAAFKANDWQLEGLDPDQLEFDLRGENKIIHVRYKQGPAIQAQAMGRSMNVDLVLAKLDGKWRVVR